VHKPVVAAFDFDGTLTRRDTLLPFLLQVAGPGTFLSRMLVLSPTLAAYQLGMLRNDIAKERVLTRFFNGMEEDTLRQQGVHFAAHTLPRMLRQQAMRRMQWHKQQGHRCVVISASLELYVQPWAQEAGFDDVIASRLTLREDGRIAGGLAEGNCYGAEKARRLQALLGAKEAYTLYAYGDSRGDRELLAMADHACYRSIP
jgi:HAD superfamily hydrolase (TIGR01490 family)